MNLTPRFKNRSFGAMLLPAPVEFRVTQMTWAAIGGCASATLTATGPLNTLFQLVELIRCPVEITDEIGRLAWWGYISEARIKLNGLEIGKTTANMANAIYVAYSYVKPGSNSVGIRATTAWGLAQESIDEYGRKEFIASQGGTSPAAAVAKRDVLLGKKKYPQGLAVPAPVKTNRNYAGAPGIATITLTATGWWETLWWRYALVGAATKRSYETTSGVADQAVGSGASNTKVVQQFTTGYWATNAQYVSVYAKKTGTPTDNLTVSLYALDSLGNPTGSALATATKAGADLTTSLGWYKLTWSAEVELAANTQYGIQVSRSGSTSGTNYFVIGVNAALGYTAGAFKIWDGADWVARSTDADMLFIAWVDNNLYNTTQIKDLVRLYGQFMTGTTILVNGDIQSSSYRDGDTYTGDEIVELMKIGGPNGRRLISKVSPDRLVEISEEPEEAIGSADYWLRSDGALLDALFDPVPEHLPPIGVWVRLYDLAPGGASTQAINSLSLQFIEGATWSEAGLQVQFSGQPSVSDIFKIKR